MGLEKILEIIIQWWDIIKFWWVVEPYNGACIFRGGAYFKTLEGGHTYWKRPFQDVVQEVEVVPRFKKLPAQALRTKDKKQIVVETTIGYQVTDVKKYMIGIWNAGESVENIGRICTKKIITSYEWDMIQTGQLVSAEEAEESEKSPTKPFSIDWELTKLTKRKMKKYGVDVLEASLTMLSEAQSYHIIGGINNSLTPVNE